MPELIWLSDPVLYRGMQVLWGAPWHPRNFVVDIPQGSNEVSMSWSDFFDYDVYIIERQAFLDGQWVHDKFFEVNETSATDVIGSGLYRYRVKAGRTLS